MRLPPEFYKMTTGIVFDIKEFTVHDGPGVRTTVFLKGCPLACIWCHNPESQSIQPQIIRSPTGERVAGREYGSAELAALLNQPAALLRANEGGITFSGGEPLFQAEFVAEVIDLLDDLHVVLDTCGHAPPADFLRVLARTDLVFYDLKLIDRAAHLRYTGVDNDLIRGNLQLLGESGKPFIIRVPLVPGVTDTDENLAGIAKAVEKMPGLVELDLLPYNRAAGAKYRYAGMEFKPDYDETRPVNVNLKIFEQAGLKVKKV
jgi:pyruvate formate lyase activating enzyme